MTRQTHIIDASDKILGRLATEVAGLLRGKGKPDFQPNQDKGDLCSITNNLAIAAKKLKADGITTTPDQTQINNILNNPVKIAIDPFSEDTGLRFPKVLNLRFDKPLKEISDIKLVEKIFNIQLVK